MGNFSERAGMSVSCSCSPQKCIIAFEKFLLSLLGWRISSSRININFTFKTLQDSLNEHKPDSDANLLSTGRWQVLMNLVLTKPMKNAEYFCAGNKGDDMEQFRHYALSVPLYTHFTSPIRRYPDVLVHRYCLIF